MTRESEKKEASRDLEVKKTELENIIEYRTKGAILRTMGGPLIFLNLKRELGRAAPFRLTFSFLGSKFLLKKFGKMKS